MIENYEHVHCSNVCHNLSASSFVDLHRCSWPNQGQSIEKRQTIICILFDTSRRLWILFEDHIIEIRYFSIFIFCRILSGTLSVDNIHHWIIASCEYSRINHDLSPVNKRAKSSLCDSSNIVSKSREVKIFSAFWSKVSEYETQRKWIFHS
jgi:hypothetical protein